MAQVKLAKGATPGTPPAGFVLLYPESDGDLAFLKEDGAGGTLEVVGHTHGTTGIQDKAVTTAKLADQAAGTVLGRAVTPETAGPPAALGAVALIAILAAADVAGSGLDADMVDGRHAEEFSLTGHTHADEIPDSGWQSLTLTGTNMGPPSDGWPSPQVRKIGKQVFLRGEVKWVSSGVGIGAGTILTLPEEYRPAQPQRQRIAASNYSSQTNYMSNNVTIATDGVVALAVTVTVSQPRFWLDGVSFLVD